MAYWKPYYLPITLSFPVFFTARAAFENSVVGNALELQPHDVDSGPAVARCSLQDLRPILHLATLGFRFLTCKTGRKIASPRELLRVNER